MRKMLKENFGNITMVYFYTYIAKYSVKSYISSLTPEVTLRVHTATLQVMNNFPAVTYSLFLFEKAYCVLVSITMKTRSKHRTRRSVSKPSSF